MPPLETMDRHQAAVLWEMVGFDDRGMPVRGEPTELQVRWTFARRFSRDPQGNTVPIDAEAVTDRVITPGSQMWLGELADWLGTGSNGNDDEVMQVVNYHTATDIKNRFRRYRITLAYFRKRPQAIGIVS